MANVGLFPSDVYIWLAVAWCDLQPISALFDVISLNLLEGVPLKWFKRTLV